ncbi:hypothetical protein B0181_02145 [Moraxella caviae]|uniref:Lysozyme inhibitor LprI N-terminal domain-containing protein n=1 Tax=Moraxella caviae TaxID=34060 RepID=A0A1T0A9Y4_9GAMM|nr:hypothetical protein [Moraxella caviae]OOR92101.1 hypothetical protein B0181_02145 [Moraxella caviae]STZ14458.1 Uncharacterised protein [Moraxella caviae]
MKIKFHHIALLASSLLISTLPAMANNYSTYIKNRTKIKNQLISCLNQEDTLHYSSAFNGCIVDAGAEFQKLGDAEYRKLVRREPDDLERLTRDRNLFIQYIEYCDNFSELSGSHRGAWTTRAICRLQASQSYYQFILDVKEDATLVDSSIPQRVDKAFLLK